MQSSFEHKVDQEYIDKLRQEELEEKQNKEDLLKKFKEDQAKNVKFGVRIAPMGTGIVGLDPRMGKNIPGGALSGMNRAQRGLIPREKPKFMLNDPHVKKAKMELRGGRMVRVEPDTESASKIENKKFSENTYIGLQPYKTKAQIAKEEEEKRKKLKQDPREKLVYQDKAEQNLKQNATKSSSTTTTINTAIPQPKIIANTSDYYQQAITSLSGDTSRQAKFAKLMGMGRSKKTEPGDADKEDKDKPNFRRTYDPEKVNENLENQFNTLRGGKTYFDN